MGHDEIMTMYGNNKLMGMKTGKLENGIFYFAAFLFNFSVEQVQTNAIALIW